MVTKVSISDSKLLAQMVRAHFFLKHEEIEFSDLRDLGIDLRTADLLSRFLQKKIDIPDAVRRMEEIALERGYFTEFLSKYVAEEYSILEDYSFTAIALLHYWKNKRVSMDDAITELISLSSSKSICNLCCLEGHNYEEKMRISKAHNLEILKGLELCETSSVEDLSSGDDSIQDPPYKQGKQSDDDSMEDEDEDDDEAQDAIKGYNPFDSSEGEDSLKLKPSLNSSVSFNPFDDDSESESNCEVNSSSKKSIECQHCKKKFSNRHNMKLHMIGFVISQL